MPREAPACRKALQDATRRWPSRDRENDGIIGDARHQKRKSDHNLGNAVDITHDPASGCDGALIAAFAIEDARVTYVIFNRRIYNRHRAADGWRPYHGENPHTHHCHISIEVGSRDDVRPWGWSDQGATPATGPTHGDVGPAAPGGATPEPVLKKPVHAEPHPGVVLRLGAHGVLVRRVQERLRALGWEIVVDGHYGRETELRVRSAQQRLEVPVSGEVDDRTWRALFR
jgi:hypothetical protein